MNTHETYVSLETAKLLKEVGFDWKCDTVYQALPDEPIVFKESEGIARVSYLFSNVWKAPTLDVAQKWLREVKDYSIMIDCITKRNWKPTIQHMTGSEDYSLGEGFKTYEEALDAGIKKALEMILEKRE